MFPGLIRTAATPASIARSASDALKWMSAITGTGDSRTSNGHAHDLAAGRGERADLGHRRLDVVRLRQRHRLDDDGCPAADGDAADGDRSLAGHALSSLAVRSEGS